MRLSPSGILDPISLEPRAAADGEETAAVLSWHTHARRVRAADVSLWSLQLQIVMGFIRWARLANREISLRTDAMTMEQSSGAYRRILPRMTIGVSPGISRVTEEI